MCFHTSVSWESSPYSTDERLISESGNLEIISVNSALLDAVERFWIRRIAETEV
jgi:hypothetical protein